MKMTLEHSGTRSLRLVAALLTGVAVLAPLANARADQWDTQYARQFRNLDARDVAGHYQLAQWCKDKRAYRLLLKQSEYVLRLDAGHAGAKLLRDLAKKRLSARQAALPADPGQTARRGPLGRIINDREVQWLRRREMVTDGSERVTVKFHNDVVAKFYEDHQDDADFKYRDRKGDFFRLKPAQKAAQILALAPETLGLDVEITSDPRLFDDYRRNVLPVVLRNCATSRCHAENGPARWRVYTGRRLTDNQVYTNFLIMHQFGIGTERLVDHDFPERSTLLRYALPPAESLTADHPSNHPVEIEPVFKSTRDPEYRLILDWIESLSIPTPDYGINLDGPAPSP
ncbi:MAG: hypothetical protein ACE5GE_11880 [Phycisphaerae bacterium]